MYRVFDKTFSSYDEVAEWAWNEHKIDTDWLGEKNHDECIQACEELETILKEEV